jgi:hypothetical protein
VILIANPIYDSVFKHLMENQEVARGLLSTLLGLKVLKLTPQPQESTDYRADMPVPEADQSGFMRVYRIDFAAVVETGAGPRKVLIELQKASVDGVVERFRTYLSKHYRDTPPLPIVGVYLLGYTLNKALPVVTKVHRRYLNGLTGRPLAARTKDDFIENLTHDGVVVQLPKVSTLKGQQSELAQLLRLFDQRQRDTNPHLLKLSDRDIEKGPPWVRRMVRLLQSVAATESVRRDMSVEDEAIALQQDRAELRELLDAERAAKEQALAAEAQERAAKEQERAEKEQERAGKELALAELAALKQQMATLKKRRGKV